VHARGTEEWQACTAPTTGGARPGARTVMGSDYVIWFLEEDYTPVERTLIEAGRFDTVRNTRNAFEDTMREAFSAAVEQAVGRKVIGFLSKVHVDPDLSIETFILEPDGTGDRRRLTAPPAGHGDHFRSAGGHAWPSARLVPRSA
jgi:uncharacterized protein YbcI